jgi:putative mRNA 3-end processing factor
VGKQDTSELVEYDGGFRLADTSLWLDALRPVSLSFVSHAVAFRRHQRLVTSSRTAELLAHKLGLSDALASPLGRPFSLGELHLELLPAGSVIGSAQLLVRHRDQRLLYCGALRPGPSWLEQPCQVPAADVVIMNCPYDGSRFTFPSRAKLGQQMVRWVQSVLAEDQWPVLLASPLGMAQEVCHLLAGAGVAVKVHRHVADWNKRVRASGLPLAKSPWLRQPAPRPVAVVAPPEAVEAGWVSRMVPEARCAFVSGSVLDGQSVERLGAEQGFALSCHGDGKALRRFIRDSGARRVFLGPRHSPGFASALRRRGLEVTQLGEGTDQSQLDLFSPVSASA